MTIEEAGPNQAITSWITSEGFDALSQEMTHRLYSKSARHCQDDGNHMSRDFGDEFLIGHITLVFLGRSRNGTNFCGLSLRKL